MGGGGGGGLRGEEANLPPFCLWSIFLEFYQGYFTGNVIKSVQEVMFHLCFCLQQAEIFFSSQFCVNVLCQLTICRTVRTIDKQ